MKIRLIPMNHEKEFKNRSIENIQKEFFMGEEMPLSAGGNCRCYNDTFGLNDVDEGDLLLFQMDSTIIASAELFSGITNISNEPGYKATYLLKKSSIKVFKPITYEELNSHCKNFSRFGQGKTELLSLGLDLEWLINRIKDDEELRKAILGTEKEITEEDIEGTTIKNQ